MGYRRGVFRFSLVFKRNGFLDIQDLLWPFFPPGIFSWDSLNSPSKLQKTPHDGGRERRGKEKNQSMNSYLAFSSSSCSSPHIWSTLRQQLSHTHTLAASVQPTDQVTWQGGGDNYFVRPGNLSSILFPLSSHSRFFPAVLCSCFVSLSYFFFFSSMSRLRRRLPTDKRAIGTFSQTG